MDSNNYENLLPGNGTGNSPVAAVWNDMSFDGNDAVDTGDPTYVSKNSYCVYILPVILSESRYNRRSTWEPYEINLRRTIIAIPLYIRVDLAPEVQCT